MASLLNGEIIINKIEISINDSLTDVLYKTITLTKIIKNINNFQHLFFNDVLVYGKKGNIKIIFSSDGKMTYLSFGISNGCKTNDKEELLSFLKKQHIILKLHNGEYTKKFYWGKLGIYNNIHEPEHYSLTMTNA